LYEWGFEIKRDLEETIYWYEMTSKQRNLEANKRLVINKNGK
jgi:TPR repeat protein